MKVRLRGSQSSGTYIPAPPTAIEALGITKLVFWDDFKSIDTIDMDATNADGFKWYPKHFWSLGTAQSDYTYDTTKASVSNSILQLNNGVVSASQARCLASVCEGPTPGSYYGFSISDKKLTWIECSMAYTPTEAAVGLNAWPAFWSRGLDAHIRSGIERCSELDFFEAYPSGAGTVQQIMAYHDWNVSHSQNRSNSNKNVTLAGTFDLSTQHRYATLWTPMALNGGVGTVKRYFDGSLVSSATISYNATTDSTPASTGSDPPSPNGIFSTIDNEADGIFLILSAGNNFKSYWDWVAVWQTPD